MHMSTKTVPTSKKASDSIQQNGLFLKIASEWWKRGTHDRIKTIYSKNTKYSVITGDMEPNDIPETSVCNRIAVCGMKKWINGCCEFCTFWHCIIELWIVMRSCVGSIALLKVVEVELMWNISLLRSLIQKHWKVYDRLLCAGCFNTDKNCIIQSPHALFK